LMLTHIKQNRYKKEKNTFCRQNIQKKWRLWDY